jgi:glutathione S-transferase
MPRPDLACIDVNYRRIPILALGKDVICDSRLIISTLEKLYPNSSIAPSSPAENGIRRLLEGFSIDGGLFANCVKLIPYWTPNGFLADQKFLDDRQGLMGGRRMTAELMEAGRPDGLQHMRQAFEILETTFLADGRKWILGGEEPTTADVDAIWPFEWLIVDPHMVECLPAEYMNEKKFPKTFGWVRRFMEEVKERKGKGPKPSNLNHEQMRERVMNAEAETQPTSFIEDDPLNLKKGDKVKVYAADYGMSHKDLGNLVGLSLTEVVIRNSKGLHLHFPRWNFRIDKVQPAKVLDSPAPKLPSMRLIYHHQSPFTRVVFLLAHELGLNQAITLQKVVVSPIPFPGWSNNNDEVAAVNPMAKIPCLISGEVPGGIYDSRIICEYLENLASVYHKKDSQYWQMHTLSACANGIMDAAILVAYEERIRKKRGLKFDKWIEGQKTKMVRGLDRFEQAAKEGLLRDPPIGPASADDVAVVVAVAMIDQMEFLGIKWRESRPALVKWFSTWEGRKSFQQTPPEKDWPSANSKSDSKI